MNDEALAGGPGNKHALIVTLEFVDPFWFSNWDGKLDAAKYDHDRAREFLSACDNVIELRNQNATRANLIARLQDLAGPDGMKGGDQLFIYFSGHGGTLPDLNGDEKDGGRDSTWCLYDGMFVHDELVELLLAFPADVLVVVISESCYAESIAFRTQLQFDRTKTSVDAIEVIGSPNAPDDVSEMVYDDYRAMYDKILKRPPKNVDDAKANILVFAACKRQQLSYFELGAGSVFTRILHKTWSDASFGGTYKGLCDTVQMDVNAYVQSRWPGLSQNPTLKPHPPTAAAMLRTKPFGK